MITLRNIGPQLHLLMKLLQARLSLVHESNLLRMRLLHCLIPAWKLMFSHLPGGKCGLKAYLREVQMDPASQGSFTTLAAAEAAQRSHLTSAKRKVN